MVRFPRIWMVYGECRLIAQREQNAPFITIISRRSRVLDMEKRIVCTACRNSLFSALRFTHDSILKSGNCSSFDVYRLSYIDLQTRVPPDHPLRTIRAQIPITMCQKAARAEPERPSALLSLSPIAADDGRAPRTVQTYRYEMQRYLGDWLSRPLDSIDAEDIRGRFERITDNHGWSAANRAISLLRSLYRKPCADIETLHNPVGAVNLTKAGRSWTSELSGSSSSGHGPPRVHRVTAELAHCLASDQMTLDIEGVVDGGVGGENPLRRS